MREGRHGLNLKAFAALFALVIGSLILPPVLMPVAAIVFLYFVPGYIAVKLLKPDLGQLEELALSVLISVMASTYIIYWMSLLLGYSNITFLLFFTLVSIASLFVKGFPDLRIGKDSAYPFLLAGATAITILLILLFSLWVPSPDGVIVGGWNYGDYFLHGSVMVSVNDGNFPPQETVYAGEPLAYHWFIDLHTAIVSKLLNIFPSMFARIDSALCVGLISLFTYFFAHHFTKSKKASLLAAFIIVFAGGFGYLRLIDSMDSAPITTLIRGDAFDNKGDFFQLPSMLPGFLLSQRPMTIGIAALAATLLLVVTGYPSDRNRLLLAGIILGMMPPFQYYAFFAAALVSALYFLYYHASTRSTKHIQNSLYVILPSLLLAFPFLLSALGRAGGMTKLGLGWSAPKTGWLDFIKFYAGNLGLAFVLAIPGYFLLKSKEKIFLALAVSLLFLIPNIITFSNTQWDMGKFFMLMMLPASVLAGAALSRLNDWLIPLVLLVCCASALTGAAFYVTSGWNGLSNEEIAAGQWMHANTTQRSVFASSSAHNTPIDSVGGRLRILGYQSWVMNYGLDFDSRHNDLKQLYCGPRENTGGLMGKYNATYVYLSGREVQEYGCNPVFLGVPGFTLEYATQQIHIYRFSG